MNQFYKFLLYSLLLHLLVIFLLKMPKQVPLTEPEVAKPIWIDLQKGKQIADILEPEKQERPDQNQFLGMYDSKVKEEQVAAVQGKSDRIQPQQPDRPGKPKQKKEKAVEKREVSKDGLYAAREERHREEESESVGGVAEALPEDFYPDFKKGGRTYLNVLRFPDIQYFVRLKRVFKMTFNPQRALEEAYLTNQISRGQIATVLGVSVDRRGELAELFVFRSSGVEHYDQEALRTIKASSPFSVPPQKLLDPDGVVRMSWTFIVYL